MTPGTYDVLVLGMELGPLAAGALLAKRGFRVLVVGQGSAFDHYRCLGFDFARRPFLLTAADSPVVRRVMAELGAGQIFQRIASEPERRFQVVLPRARLDVFKDRLATEAEIGREFPPAGGAVPGLLEGIGRLSCEIDKLLSVDMVLPPETFFEKRELARAEVQNPFRLARSYDVLEGTEAVAGLREFLEAPARFETCGASMLHPLVLVRQLGGWLFGCQNVQGGRDGLRKLLCDRIVAQGGDVLPRHRVADIAVAKGRVTGVRLAGREDSIAVRTIVTGLVPDELAALITPSAWTKRFRAMVEDAGPPVLGYAVNLGFDALALPAGLGHTCFARFGPGLGDELLRIEALPQAEEGKAALNVSCVVPTGAEGTIASGALRDAMLDRMRWLVPYLDNHLRVLHSPFDGFGPVDLTGRATGESPSVPHPEEVPACFLHPPLPDGILGIEGLPHRTGVAGLLLAGAQVVRGLGAEGELLAGWGAARIAGRMDPVRERLARSMRSKVEM
ncbi:MAG: hypothetical protein PHU25_06710 [Deltaproteobacteria bacterium]|nr:hypothetical protein [Deltaproteobacteria bacterium]